MGDLIMKNKRKIIIQDRLIVGLLLSCMTSIVLAQDNVKFEDVVVLTVPHGQGLGKVIVNCSPGGRDVPTCFWIDPNGTFYVPEINSTNKGWMDIRIHKFRPNGTPIEVINVEGIADSIWYMTTSDNGDIYLVESVIGLAETYIGHYDKNGKLISRFGRNGEITKGDFNKIIYGDPRKEFVRNTCFSFLPILVFGTQKDTIYAVERLSPPDKPNTYRFNTKAAILSEKTLENENLPQEIIRHKNKFSEKLARREKLDGASEFATRGYSIVGPDGEYYFMRTYFQAPKRVEIHKLTFEE
jgi:hypothetical protein